MSKSRRTLVNIGIFGSLFFIPIMPWYIIFLACVIASWHYVYYEFLLIGFIMDMAYGSAQFFTIAQTPFALPCTAFAALVLIVLHLVKKRVRF